MELTGFNISNFKSIKDVTLEITPINKSYTYSLLGINESGKSSFLTALASIKDGQIQFPMDFTDKTKGVEIQLYYSLNNSELKALEKILAQEFKCPKELLSRMKLKDVCIGIYFSPNTELNKEIYEAPSLENSVFEDYTFINKEIIKRDPNNETHKSLDVEELFDTHFKNYFQKISHNIIFWKSSPEYLILEEIDLNNFGSNPRSISVPLMNCFKLAGISEDQINSQIESLRSAVDIANLEAKLGKRVTDHINTVWPEHPISIAFNINNNRISLLVNDNGIEFNAKTAKQRSDGFRQFISFLLTLSAENHTKELSNTILLIDEPETHLHPPAQINLLNELIKITSNDNNNIVFFATHSNYMIDKSNLDRCFKVEKVKNEHTQLTRIETRTSSYAEVNYEIFDIATTDYHNELYGYVESEEIEKLNSLPKNKKWKNAKTDKTEDVSLSKYIRNAIHHPENDLNPNYTEPDLRKSITILKGIKYS
jgi:predicted ATP-dependent endonuclease of OLD family